MSKLLKSLVKVINNIETQVYTRVDAEMIKNGYRRKVN